MLKMQELDSMISIRDQQMDAGTEPVILVNVFHAAPDQTDALLSAWADGPVAGCVEIRSGVIS
jgi:hypothetical protein